MREKGKSINALCGNRWLFFAESHHLRVSLAKE